MARGWESKAVESQQDDHQARVRGRAQSAGEREAADRRAQLTLSAARVRQDLARATAPAHRAMLEQALAALESELNAPGA